MAFEKISSCLFTFITDPFMLSRAQFRASFLPADPIAAVDGGRCVSEAKKGKS